MDKVHPSKVDNWLLMLVMTVALFVLLAATLLSLRGLAILGLLLLIFFAVLPMWVVMATRYHLTGNELRVHAGPFRWRVPLHSISAMEACHNGLLAPAMSRERLKLVYGDGDTLYISPQDRYQFILDVGVVDPELEE
jgi:hypothetical protein